MKDIITIIKDLADTEEHECYVCKRGTVKFLYNEYEEYESWWACDRCGEEYVNGLRKVIWIKRVVR